VTPRLGQPVRLPGEPAEQPPHPDRTRLGLRHGRQPERGRLWSAGLDQDDGSTGGGIYLTSTLLTTITGCTFTGNRASQGPAVDVEYSSPEPLAVLTNSITYDPGVSSQVEPAVCLVSSYSWLADPGFRPVTGASGYWTSVVFDEATSSGIQRVVWFARDAVP